MKFLFFCILSLGIFSCNNPKDNSSKGNIHKTETGHKAKSSSSFRKNKDSVYIELKQSCFIQGDSIVIEYCIKNATRRNYTYLSDEYWIEEYVRGKWIRVPNDLGSILMGKDIPANSSTRGRIRVSLKEGHYRFCNTAYYDDAGINDKRIIMKADFEVRPYKRSN